MVVNIAAAKQTNKKITLQAQLPETQDDQMRMQSSFSITFLIIHEGPNKKKAPWMYKHKPSTPYTFSRAPSTPPQHTKFNLKGKPPKTTFSRLGD